MGLLNDPNGLVQHEGTYHLCYQWHPFAPKHALKFWAHLTSTDLVHWTQQPIALAPSQPYESHGCYSGSGIVHDGAVRFLYTGNVRTPDGGRTPMQLLATLNADGTVTKHPANPLIGAIPGCSAHVRDPKVWTRDGAHWMVLGAQTQDLHGTALLLRSPDLIEWQYLGQLAGGADDPFGYMWECPDLVRLDDRDVLIISPSSTTARPRARTGGRTCRCTPSATWTSTLPAFARHGGLPAGGRRPRLLRPTDPHRRHRPHDHDRVDGYARPRRPTHPRREAPDSGQRLGALPDRAPRAQPRRRPAGPVAGPGALRPARPGRDPGRASRSTPAHRRWCSTVSPALPWTWT